MKDTRLLPLVPIPIHVQHACARRKMHSRSNPGSIWILGFIPSKHKSGQSRFNQTILHKRMRDCNSRGALFPLHSVRLLFSIVEMESST